jgi:GrpB-like predicted nucleotidyltransferase (UPF0157 family)
MPHLRPSRELLARARFVLERERLRLSALTTGQLVLTGGSSVPGALTVGDIDLHLRVDPAEFAESVARLRELYEPVHLEIWTESLATFSVSREDVGIAVTPVGSEHDRRFVGAWRRLQADPSLLEAYNRMKRDHADGADADYLAAKADFFNSLAQE